MDALDRAIEQAEAVNRRLDRKAGYSWLAGTITDPRVLAKLLAVAEQDSAEIAEEARKLRRLLYEIRTRERERLDKGESTIVQKLALTVIMILLALMLIGGMPTRAQDATAEATVESTATLVSSEPIVTPAPAATEQPPVVVIPAETPGDTQLIDLVKQALPWAGAVAIVALIVVGTLGHQAIVNLGRSAPAPVREVAITSGDSVLKQVEDYVKTTPTTIDDVAAAELRKLFDKWVAEMRTIPPDQQGRVG